MMRKPELYGVVPPAAPNTALYEELRRVIEASDLPPAVILRTLSMCIAGTVAFAPLPRPEIERWVQIVHDDLLLVLGGGE